MQVQNEFGEGELTVTSIRGLAILNIVATSLAILTAWLAKGLNEWKMLTLDIRSS